MTLGRSLGYYGYGLAAAPMLAVIGIIAGLVIGILVCVLILPAKKRGELSPFFKKIHDYVQFKYLWIESIIKVLYIISTCVLTLVGFLLLFGPTFLIGLLLMLIGIVGNRLIYEGILISILILRNTQQINNKLSGGSQAPGEDEDAQGAGSQSYQSAGRQSYQDAGSRNYRDEGRAYDPYYGAGRQQKPEPEPKWRFCSQCGTRYDANKGGCPNGCE